MQDHYEINVALNGMHFFATNERSIVSHFDLERILPTIVAKFPESEGYEVSVIYWSCGGKHVRFNSKGEVK